MPIKKTYKKKPRARKAVPRKSVKAITRTTKFLDTVNLGGGFPMKLKVTHKYCQTLDLVSSLGITGHYLFSCNGMYDPDVTGIGGQPMAYDQISVLYDHYQVIGAKFTARILPSSAGNPAMQVGVRINDSTVTGQSFLQLKENNGACTRVISSGATSDKPTVIVCHWSPKKVFGGSILAQEDMKGTISSNPIEQSYFQLFNQCFDGISSGSLTFAIEIEYIAIWTEFKAIARS